jgi:RNA polymerase sigma factor (sigma-70 family)
MDYARFLEEHLAVVDRVVRGIAIAGRLSAADAGDFRGEALLHLVADDYRVLRAFEGRSSLATYLNVVLRRLWQDRCARRWGRWRPSAEARRLGPAAVRLECLVQRDGMTLDEAISTMHGTANVDALELRAMWRRLAPRSKRCRVGDDVLAEVPDGRPDVAATRERREAVTSTSRVLERVVTQLSAEDRRLLHLRFVDGASMADAARSLGLRQAAIYPRFTRLLGGLRTVLEAEGLRAPDALAHLGADVGTA